MPKNNFPVKFKYITQEKFNQLENYDENTVYFITGKYKKIYLGNETFVDFSSILEIAYPIGKIEIFFDNEDHSSHLGFKWERCLIGRSPIGIDSNDNDLNSIGNQLGEKTHTLNVDEMPSHNHSFWYGGTSTGSKVAVGWHALVIDDTNKYGGINNTGGDQPHNNMQPSEVVSFWKRIE